MVLKKGNRPLKKLLQIFHRIYYNYYYIKYLKLYETSLGIKLVFKKQGGIG